MNNLAVGGDGIDRRTDNPFDCGPPGAEAENAPEHEAEEILNRIKNHKGVVGILVVNSEGLVIKSTFDQQQSDLHASLLTQLSNKARDVIRELDPQNDINFLRLRSKKHEIMIAPDKDYTLVVVQDPYADREK
ncbi:hypothetical protein PVMG_02480 [Plasmodium vivax Mauritania I]|uniref:Roadblock/LAMTOR2 domain-containing protein n=2 Tax=Plasmodium vivax TaxID=5855 RepID=A0A0J9TGF5_PLAVI|nr:hypothetical protein PVBG_03828 [Plasmodium vivax Brazil I]KMZ94254.1 hypothetical protein PVMG_02480 [Plasmodium vivax Mauritania I]